MSFLIITQIAINNILQNTHTALSMKEKYKNVNDCDTIRSKFTLSFEIMLQTNLRILVTNLLQKGAAWTNNGAG